MSFALSLSKDQAKSISGFEYPSDLQNTKRINQMPINNFVDANQTQSGKNNECFKDNRPS